MNTVKAEFERDMAKKRSQQIDVRGYETWDVNGKRKLLVSEGEKKVGDHISITETLRSTKKKKEYHYIVVAMGNVFFDDRVNKHLQYAYLNEI